MHEEMLWDEVEVDLSLLGEKKGFVGKGSVLKKCVEEPCVEAGHNGNDIVCLRCATEIFPP